MSTLVADPAAECANCGHSLQGPFCSQCGQKVTHLNPTLGEFLHDLVHEIVHVDGKIVTSFRLLLTRPGFLSLEHFAGRRARYVTPIRLYLLMSVLFFGMTAIAPSAGGRITCTSCPPEVRAEREREMAERLTHWFPRAMFVLVPVFAGLVALTARRAGRRYPEHLYFSMHVHAVWFFAGTLFTATAFVASVPYVRLLTGLALMLYAGHYFTVAFRGVYGSRSFVAVLGTGAIVVMYLVAVLVCVAAMLLPIALRP